MSTPKTIWIVRAGGINPDIANYIDRLPAALTRQNIIIGYSIRVESRSEMDLVAFFQEQKPLEVWVYGERNSPKFERTVQELGEAGAMFVDYTGEKSPTGKVLSGSGFPVLKRSRLI